MKNVYDTLYSGDKYNAEVNQDQFKWLMDRDLSGVQTAFDFGCGRGHVLNALASRNIEVTGVDFSSEPERPGKVKFVKGDIRTVDLGQKADLVVCHDVLEHIEKRHIEEVVANLAKHAEGFISLAIANHSDIWNGKELHLIREEIDWWADLLERHFEILEAEERLNNILYLFWCKTNDD